MRSARLLVAFLSMVHAGCDGRRPPTESGAACANGRDDDGDGASDCADADCATTTTCTDVGDGGVADAGLRDVPPRDVPPELCTAPIDLTFVLDVSTSMAMEAGALRDGIGAIYAAAQALTTDTRFSLVVFVDDALVLAECAAYPSVDVLVAEFDRWRAFCASNRSPVSERDNYDCAENSLDAIYAAATRCTWRPEATHLLIHVTDDTFLERPATFSADPFTGGGIPAAHTYAEVSAELIAREIRVGAFAMEVPEDCGAGTSADTGQGFFTPYRGMPALPMATSGRVWDIADVRAGTLPMATAIAEMVEEEHCTPFLE